ncbi:MAG: hypothetical protein C4518_07220 [Desulfobacteraceae bacterium]|nr:MAG: hypothetical protein C4518_07220 [Desulfobacteraceae bacterium]
MSISLNCIFHQYIKAILLLCGAWTLVMTPALAQAADNEIHLLLTANLNGRFGISADNQDTEDPMLIMAQSLIRERKTKPTDLYVDLGNAFYPGLLSRFSYGSVMMDFLDYFDCAATLVSSQDLNIGVGNLEFLSKGKKTRLLSANVKKDGKPVFAPYFIHTIKGKKIAFIGLTSDKGFLDIAEKKILDVTVNDHEKTLADTIAQLQLQHVDYMVALSGRSYSENLALMEKFTDISLCISGGDATGELYAAKAERVDIGAGRSIVTLTNPAGYYVLSLSAGQKLSVNSLVFSEPGYSRTRDSNYVDFANRLTIWKERFSRDGEAEVVKNTVNVFVDDMRVAELLRDRFGAEVVILEKNTINPVKVSGNITYAGILKMVNNEFPLFTYKLSGSELKKVALDKENLVIAGTDGQTVQGYLIEDKRSYQICSPQSVYDSIVKRLDIEIKYTNSWKTIPDEIRADLNGEQVIALNDYGYLDNRYRILTDIFLSNFYDKSNVSRDDDMDTPPGKPGKSYEKWGLEDKIDVTVYNRIHKYVFTPYVFYIRQDDTYYQNLLRGTLLYTYNLSPTLKPYLKSRVDTVVKVVDDLRPLLFRETFGVQAEMEHVTGKMGLGFEKQTQDPNEDLLTGLETIVGVKYDLLKNLRYTMDIDTFIAFQQVDIIDPQIRAEVTNALSCGLNSFMAVSAKHKWFYVNSVDSSQQYRDSQFLLTLDLVTDFKFF